MIVAMIDVSVAPAGAVTRSLGAAGAEESHGSSEAVQTRRLAAARAAAVAAALRLTGLG
jgi:hypothetical protein